MKERSNRELEMAYRFLSGTSRHVFLTGKAGTGKTTFLKKIVAELPKQMAVVAPTGVAAINAGGVTIHSLFQLPPELLLPGWEKRNQVNKYRFSKAKRDILRHLDLLIIDEISMVRADLLDAMDEIMRRYRRSDKVFGGAQVLMIGDLQQLSPVTRKNEWSLLSQYYDTPYFFSSRVFRQMNPVVIELKEVFRQENETFIRILNEIREGKISAVSLEKLNRRYIPGFEPDEDERYIRLTTHNRKADAINLRKLEALKGKKRCYKAKITGKFPGNAFPTDPELCLKPEAQVMFVRNDPTGAQRYFNGKIGRVVEVDTDTVSVDTGDEIVVVGREEWEYATYETDPETLEIKRKVEGTLSQFPLRLAWAITIHKSQGLTFDQAIIDVESAFTHGQTYVALSRCRTLEGLVLSAPVTERQLIYDQRVSRFIKDAQNFFPDEETLRQSRKTYLLEWLSELYDYEPVKKNLDRLVDVLYQNPSVIQTDDGHIPEKLRENEIKEAVKIANRFLPVIKKEISQLQSDFFEGEFKERLIKSAAYFEKISKEALDRLERFAFDTDNMEMERKINGLLEEIITELQRKTHLMNGLRKDFSTEYYLKLKRLFEAGRQERKKEKKPKISRNVLYPDLFEALRSLRYELSQVENVPPYRIFTQETLYELVEKLPVTLKQLKKIKGIGKARLEQYGEDIVDTVKAFCIANEIPMREDEKPKLSSREISLQMYLEGKTPAEIALERDLTEETVIGHLLKFLNSGQVNIEDLIENQKLKEILQLIESYGDESLTLLKEKSGDRFSYTELRIARTYYLIRQKKK